MKTMVLLYPGCIEFEVMLACEILNRKFPVEVVTPDGKDHVGSSGMTIRAAKALSSMVESDYKVALFPGGDPTVLMGNELLNRAIQVMQANHTVLGAICAGPVILEQAGVLRGRRIAHGYKDPQIKWLHEHGYFSNTQLTDEAMVVADNIVTARPDSFIDFAVEVAVLSGAIDPSKRCFWQEYYRGRPQVGP